MATDKTVAEWARFHGLTLDAEAARFAFNAAVTIEANDRELGMAGPPITPKSVPRESVVAVTRRLQANNTVPAADYLMLCAYIVDLERAFRAR
jgi:hypothetical protein